MTNALEFTFTYRGVPVGTVVAGPENVFSPDPRDAEIDPRGAIELVFLNFRAGRGYAAIQPILKLAWQAFSNLGYLGPASDPAPAIAGQQAAAGGAHALGGTRVARRARTAPARSHCHFLRSGSGQHEAILGGRELRSRCGRGCSSPFCSRRSRERLQTTATYRSSTLTPWLPDTVTVIIPQRLAESCKSRPERIEWLHELPAVISGLARRWSLSVDAPFDHSDGNCAWVAPATRADGEQVVLKVAMPHMEADQEIDGLRFWAGDPTVSLLESDQSLNAMLLERCIPGTSLRSVPEPEQDSIIAQLLRRLWRVPRTPHAFRPLSLMTAFWCDATRADSARWHDRALVREGLGVFEYLASASADDVLLATDLHAGNVLRAEREPWLVIDPKPFLGDAAYDATQHLFNCRERVQSDPDGTIRHFADLLGVDHERVRLWMFARAAAEPRDNWSEESMALARILGA